MMANSFDLKKALQEIERLRNAPEPDCYYYFHGGRQKAETGLSAKEFSKRVASDRPVIVIDPKTNEIWQGGKLLDFEFKPKGGKKIKFPAINIKERVKGESTN